MPTVPSYLASRAAKARKLSDQARANQPAQPAPPAPQQPVAAPPAPPTQPPIKIKLKPNARQNVAKPLNQGGGDLEPALPAEDALLAMVRGHSKAAPSVLAAVEPHLPALFAAMMAGAKIPGNKGVSDRSMVWRMLQVPWATAASSTPGGGGSLADLQDRLTRAVSRVESGRRRVSVTMTMTSEDEPADDSGSDGDALVFKEHVRSPLPAAAEPLTLDGVAEERS